MPNLSTPESVAACLAELAPRLDAIDAIVQNEDDSWTVGFEDELGVLIEWADDPPRLVLSAELGRPAPEQQPDILRTALSYNLLWRESGGARIGQGHDDDELVLLREWHPDVLDDSELATVIENFAQLARWWRRGIQENAESPALPSPIDFIGLKI